MSKPALLKKGLRHNLVFVTRRRKVLSCRNLPYLKRDCDKFITIFIQISIKSRNLPYLKRDCDITAYTPHRSSPAIPSKPALLKKGLRPINHLNFATPSITSRNLPYLKRDCDIALQTICPFSSSSGRNLPYLKRDCDVKYIVFLFSGTLIVETCPT